MAVSGGLAALKIFTGAMSGSNSLLADGFESAGDVVSSFMVFLGLTLAAKPADSNHPYGHGRAEILSGLALGIMLFLGGLAIAVHALLGAGDVIGAPARYAVYPLVFSIGVKAWLMRLKYRQGRKMGSASLVADAYNDAIDMISGVAALTALGLTLYDPLRFPRADHYGGFAVGLIVMFTGTRVARDTGLQLMDTMPDGRLLDRIRAVALSVAGVLGVEKCFARKTGLQYHVDLHLEVDPGITVMAGHDIAARARDAIRGELSWVADVLVHVEPAPPAVTMTAMDTTLLPKLPDVVLRADQATRRTGARRKSSCSSPRVRAKFWWMGK
jgi:cation diffusion facilitator family transporter